MAVRVVDVILPGLFESAQSGKLRDEQIDQPDIVHEPQSADVPVCHAEFGISRVGGEGLVQLREYPLLRYIKHLRRIALRGKESCTLRRKAEFGGKAHQAQHPGGGAAQMIRVTAEPGRLTLEGHAGYAPTGKDIVCAAVSALVLALAERLQEKNLVRRVPFVLELRNVPFRQQEQITWYLMDGLPGLLGAAFDARGNGAYLAEYAMQRYGSGRVQQVMPTEGWYREHMPPVKAALEDGNLVDLPKDEDTLDDLRAVQVVNGVPRVPEQRSKAKADGGKRHGDSAIALALAYFASREINKGPVKASSRRRRQAARMLEGF